MNLDPRKIIFEEPEERDFVVFPKGVYPFTILEINTMTESKEKRTPMLLIKLQFTRANGDTTTVYENLLFQDNAMWKISQFLKCLGGNKLKAGQSIDFESTDFIYWLKRQGGSARLKVSPVRGKDYDRNEVEAFIFNEGAKVETPAPRKIAPLIIDDSDDDEEIPF